MARDPRRVLATLLPLLGVDAGAVQLHQAERAVVQLLAALDTRGGPVAAVRLRPAVPGGAR